MKQHEKGPNGGNNMKQQYKHMVSPIKRAPGAPSIEWHRTHFTLFQRRCFKTPRISFRSSKGLQILTVALYYISKSDVWLLASYQLL